jgi:hypothetical protein
MDMRLSQIDYQTGKKSAGLTTGSRTDYTLEHTVLCQAPDGRAQSCNSSQQVRLTVIDGDGELVFGEVVDGTTVGRFRENDEHSAVIGWSPFFQHTSSRAPRSCDSCHRTDDSEEEWTRVRGVYGYGTGEYSIENLDGEPVDPLQFIDADGQATTSFVHEGTGPLSAEVRDRALGVLVDP